MEEPKKHIWEIIEITRKPPHANSYKFYLLSVERKSFTRIKHSQLCLVLNGYKYTLPKSFTKKSHQKSCEEIHNLVSDEQILLMEHRTKQVNMTTNKFDKKNNQTCTKSNIQKITTNKNTRIYVVRHKVYIGEHKANSGSLGGLPTISSHGPIQSYYEMSAYFSYHIWLS